MGYTAGMVIGRNWAAQEAESWQQNAQEWKGYAKKLESQLDNAATQAEQQKIFTQLNYDGKDYMLNLVLDALQKADPSSPLLNLETRVKLIRNYKREMAPRFGYTFDVEKCIYQKR